MVMSKPNRVEYDDHQYYCVMDHPLGSMQWAFDTFKQDAKERTNRVALISGKLLFAHEEDYVLFMLRWA